MSKPFLGECSMSKTYFVETRPPFKVSSTDFRITREWHEYGWTLRTGETGWWEYQCYSPYYDYQYSDGHYQHWDGRYHQKFTSRMDAFKTRRKLIEKEIEKLTALLDDDTVDHFNPPKPERKPINTNFVKIHVK